MKVCGACCIELPREKFSKKQWKLNQRQRRCIECIDANREAGTLFVDKALFQQPPRKEDCPICFLRLPSLSTGNSYMSCCGKTICTGCLYAGAMVGDDQLCPFCRVPAPTSEELVKRVKTRMDVGDAEAMYELGCCYSKGKHGLPQDDTKAIDLWHQAGELGCATAYYNIAFVYLYGRGVERDEIKSKYYCELAAMRGDVSSRYNLGIFEKRDGNIGRALKHFMIAAGDGSELSLKQIKQLFMKGHATKDDYAKALQACQVYLGEIRSVQRDTAAAFDENNSYFE